MDAGYETDEGLAGDRVDQILGQWAQERPDLDTGPMGVVGRISRAAVLLDHRLGEAFSAHGITPGDFDVLATLTRAGSPHEVTVGTLMRSLMVASGTVTHRLNRLESSGLITRRIDPSDRRGVLVALTERGRDLTSLALEDHLSNEVAILDCLAAEDKATLARILRRLLIALGDTPSQGE